MGRWSLRARFLLLLLVLLALLFTAITLIIVRQTSATLKTNLVNESKSFASLATQPIGAAFVLYQHSGTIQIQQQVEGFTARDPHINQVEVVDTTGRSLFVQDPAHPISVDSGTVMSLDPSYIYQNGNLVTIVQPYVENYGVHRYAIVYGISYQSVDQSIRSIVNDIILLSAAIALISFVVWYILISRLFLFPVASISRVALQISQGELDRKVQLNRNDEIGDLANAVNTMATSLKADITKLKEVDEMKSEFMMITSHNLRTPLTVIDAYLDQINTLKPNVKFQAFLKPISVSVMRLGLFAEDVLTISTIEAGQKILHQEPTEMGPVLQSIANEFAVMAAEKDITFTTHLLTTPVWVNLSKAHFRSALWNLLDNANKFTSDGGTVELAVQTEGGQLKISVRDTGVGIAPSELPKLFTKFHRGTSTTTYNYEGTGIGLYIAKLIIEQHGGTIMVQSTQGKGSLFTISLPIMPPAATTPATA